MEHDLVKNGAQLDWAGPGLATRPRQTGPGPYSSRLAGNRFRFVSIAPAAAWDDDVRCELRQASLADDDGSSVVRYRALSYVWGCSKAKRPILVDGFAVRATANLDLALRLLRSPTEHVDMWIDALVRFICYPPSSSPLCWQGVFVCMCAHVRCRG